MAFIFEVILPQLALFLSNSAFISRLGKICSISAVRKGNFSLTRASFFSLFFLPRDCLKLNAKKFAPKN